MSGFHFSPRTNRAADINWREWGDAAFEQARDQNRPILLAISAVWCHWCHVMDETTYSSDDVIELINRRYVPVRVDNDQRPDINARYNQGGWPTTAILTPDGEILKGATYVPPDQMFTLLSQVGSFYADPENRIAIARRMTELKTRRDDARAQPAGALKPDIADRVFSFLDANFDERYGGFGSDQKFPMTSALHFLLDRWQRTRDDRSREIAVKSLRAMAGGGMYDRVHGGFYRYSTTRDFSVPHFEKMLEDLGGLLLACARCAAMFDDAKLGRIAIEVRSYIDERLWNATFGAYGGSQDADESYYALDAAGRATLAQPYVDPTIFASWNAETARALITGGPLLERFGADASDWTQRGTELLETLWSRLVDDGLACRYYDGEKHIRGLLGDQAWTAWALLSAYEASGATMWLDRALTIVNASEVLFDSQAGMYADRVRSGDELGRVAEPSFPLDDNSLMARALIKAAALTGDDKHRDRARSLLESNADSYRGYGMFAAEYGSAALDWFSPPVEVRIIGASTDSGTVALRETARRAAPTALTIEVVDPDRDASRMNSLGHTNGRAPTAYLCDERSCFAKTSDAAELEAVLSRPHHQA
ncbi:MAG TPA: DUF255 domain-containing protein [Candidatus Eremiobacteraceae bacterium]|nr:DUF255 domain-containing protein [Candidatus Eremiobacteraceae bacterium]